MASKEPETSLAIPSSSTGRVRLPLPSPSAKTLERVEEELRRRYNKRRICPNAVENENSGTELTARSNVTSGEDVANRRSMSNEDGNQEHEVSPDGEQNAGDERQDSSGDQLHTSKRCRRRHKSSLNEVVKHGLVRASPSSERVKEGGGSLSGNGGNDEKKGDEAERKDPGERSEDGPLPNNYREEYRMRYRELSRQKKTQPVEDLTRRGRTKRTLTGRTPLRRVVPAINDSIWRVQYETGCLPGGSNEFMAPKRQDYDVCESLDRAGYVGIGLLAKKLGYHVKEMKSLGGYGIEVETDDRVELSWSPPDSEYSRVILTKLPSRSGLWVVDVECGFEYNGTRPFEMPSWRTVGPFESIEDAVAEAKKQVGAKRGWEWERVALDGAFEIKKDDASGWEGHWNPEVCEYSRVVVKMIGWPETRYEHTCSCKYSEWRKAFSLELCVGSKGGAIRVEWRDSS